MNRKTLYLLLCILGFALPYSQFIPWLLQNGFDMPLFARQLFTNRISAFFVFDVLVSAVVLIGFVRSEGGRLKMTKLWLPIVAVCLVGVSLGLPLFLYLREDALAGPTNGV